MNVTKQDVANILFFLAFMISDELFLLWNEATEAIYVCFTYYTRFLSGAAYFQTFDIYWTYLLLKLSLLNKTSEIIYFVDGVTQGSLLGPLILNILLLTSSWL